jgi:hypothetical protein
MKISKVILIVFAVSVTLPDNLLAQSDCYYHCGVLPDINEKYYVYSDVANVRTLPDIDSEISFKLSAGREVMVVSYKENSDEIDGVSGNWYFIKTTDGIKREGWMWSETLSCKQLRRGDTKFVFGTSKTTEDDCTLTVKVIENGKIVDTKKFKTYFAVSFSNARIIDSVNLRNVKYVVHLIFDTYGCNEIGEDEYYFAWLDEKKKLVKLPETSSFSGGKEDLYIPTKSNRGISNLLIKIIANALEPKNVEDTYNYEKWEYEYRTELFKWNGEKIIKIAKTL